MENQSTAAAQLSYVLITAARNEEAYIELTIKSVVSQTVTPRKWIIVSDASTDRTDEIVQAYGSRYPWIDFVRMSGNRPRQFASKVECFNAGLARLFGINYDIIGNLDADLSFDPLYFEFLLGQFASDPQLGVGGTPFTEDGMMYDYRFASLEHVSGACQLFRKECFETIGGYMPLKLGGIDLAAVTTARMLGWKTRSFLDKTLTHHKKTQSSGYTSLRNTFRSGYHDYLMGSDALWQLFRACNQLAKRPVGVRAGALFLGYIWALMTRAPRPVSQQFVQFRSREQRRRLGRILRNMLKGDDATSQIREKS